MTRTDQSGTALATSTSDQVIIITQLRALTGPWRSHRFVHILYWLSWFLLLLPALDFFSLKEFWLFISKNFCQFGFLFFFFHSRSVCDRPVNNGFVSSSRHRGNVKHHHLLYLQQQQQLTVYWRNRTEMLLGIFIYLHLNYKCVRSAPPHYLVLLKKSLIML